MGIMIQKSRGKGTDYREKKKISGRAQSNACSLSAAQEIF